MEEVLPGFAKAYRAIHAPPSFEALYTFPRRVSLLGVARDTVICVAREVFGSPDGFFELQTAAGEALANAFEHGTGDSVYVAVAVLPHVVIIDIVNEGVARVCDIDKGLPLMDIERERGRGIPIMKEMLDGLEITSVDGVIGIRLIKDRG